MTQPPIPDADETRAGFRSGEGSDSVLRHLTAAARRLTQRKAGLPDSRMPSELPPAAGGGVDIPLPP